MKDKKLLYKLLLTGAAVLALVSNWLPILATEVFGFSTSLSAINFFDMEYLEYVIGLSGETNLITVIKVIIAVFMVLDIASAIIAWAVPKRSAGIAGIVTGLAQSAWWTAIVIICNVHEDIKELMSYGLSFGAGIWGFILAGILICVMGFLLFFSGEYTVGSKKTKKHAKGMLLGVSGEYAGAEIPVGDTPVILGRDQNECHVIFQSERISRKHCSIVYDEVRGIYIVKDFSSNGTYLEDGRRLKAKESNELQSGEQLQIGKNEIFKLL